MNALSRLLARFTFLRWMALVGLMLSAASPALAADDHGNTPATATALTLGVPMNGNIEIFGDIDYFSINLVAGQRYLFEMTPTGAGALTSAYLSLYNSTLGLVSWSGNVSGSNAAVFVYQPATTGTYYLKAITQSNLGTGTYTVKASVEIPSAPIVSLSPTFLSFPDQIIGTISPTQAIVLTNTGTATLNITSVLPSVNDFAVNHTCNASLAPSVSCNINVSFTPGAAGTRVGSITLVSSAAGSPHSVTASGTGVDSRRPVCQLTANPPSIVKGRSSTLTPTCTPAADTYFWTGGTCQGTTAPTCTVTPAVTTPYGVTGTNPYGSSTASAQVTVKAVDLTPILMLLLD